MWYDLVVWVQYKVIFLVFFREKMDEFKTNMPIIQTLGNPGMKARHWEKISEIVGFPIIVDDELSLEKVIDFNLVDYIEKFEGISEAATKENNLEKALDKMMKEWADLRFEILPYKLVHYAFQNSGYDVHDFWIKITLTCGEFKHFLQ